VFNDIVFNDSNGLSNDSDVLLFNDIVDDVIKHVNAIIILISLLLLKRIGYSFFPTRYRRYLTVISQITSVWNTRRGPVFKNKIIKKSNDDSDDGSYIFNEKKKLKRDEDEKQNINIITEKNNNSKGEAEIIIKIKKRYEY
jgi:hypothetical protein